MKSILKILQFTNFKIEKMQLKGGVSPTEEYKAKGFLDKLLWYARITVMIVADLLNKGQVLVVYARKQGE